MKKRTLLWLVLALVVFGGGAWMAQEINVSGEIVDPSPKGKWLAYLKKHEEEMANFIKSRNPKVESVQFNWDSMEIGQIGNGTPQGGGDILTIEGRINNIKFSSFTLGFPLDHDEKSSPLIDRISEMQPIRVLKGNVWEIYD